VKKLIRPLAAGAGVAGGLAALNRGLRKSRGPNDVLGGTPREWRWRGHDIYVREAGQGPLVVLVHGIYAGASSYEFRNIFPLLAQRYRVVAFDLLGCGLSAMPNIDYSTDLFTEQILDALDTFGPEPAILVGSSLGAAFSIRATARANDRVSHLVTICPTGLAGVLDRENPGGAALITSTLRSPLIGESLFNGLASRPSLRWFLQNQAYGDPNFLTDEILEHFSVVTHQKGARYVPAHFVGGGLNCNVARDLPFVDAPILICWGEHASATSPLANAGEFAKLARRSRLATFAHSGLLPHEEEPAATFTAIDSFVSST
jgi:pimeloyl-ACP methyl ester carboxylesterase